MGRILRTFLAGVLALLPIAVTVFVTAWVASLIAGYAGPGSFVGRLITTLGTSLGLDIEPSSTAAYLLGLAIILGAIFALGVVVELGLRSFVLNSLDWLMRRIPIISNIYDLSKRFVAIVDRGDQGDLKSMQPGLVLLRRRGGRGGARLDAVAAAGGDRRAPLSRPAGAVGAGAVRRRLDLCAGRTGSSRPKAASSGC